MLETEDKIGKLICTAPSAPLVFNNSNKNTSITNTEILPFLIFATRLLQHITAFEKQQEKTTQIKNYHTIQICYYLCA